jgi:hypothetical protein
MSSGFRNTAVNRTDKVLALTHLRMQDYENTKLYFRVFNGRLELKGYLSISLGKKYPLFPPNIITRVIVNTYFYFFNFIL